MKLKQEHLVLLGMALILALAAYGGYALLLQPMDKKIKSATKTLTEEKERLEDAKAKAAQYEKFLAEAENVRRGLQFLNSRLDPRLGYQEEMDLFFGLVTSFKGYEVKNSKPEPSKEGVGLNQIPITVKFESNYHDTGRFLTQAISQTRLIYPKGFHLAAKDNTGHTTSLTASLDFWVLLKVPPK